MFATILKHKFLWAIYRLSLQTIALPNDNTNFTGFKHHIMHRIYWKSFHNKSLSTMYTTYRGCFVHNKLGAEHIDGLKRFTGNKHSWEHPSLVDLDPASKRLPLGKPLTSR